MPKKERPGQFGDFWLSQRTGSENWYKTWYESTTAGGRRTRRESLGVADFEEAKLKLAQWVISHGSTGLQKAEKIFLAQVFQRYWIQHARYLLGKGAGVQRRNLEVLTECAGDLVVSDFKLARQHELVRELREERGYSVGYIRRIFSTGFAAINWAFNNEEIDRKPPQFHCRMALLRNMWPQLKCWQLFGIIQSLTTFKFIFCWHWQQVLDRVPSYRSLNFNVILLVG